MMWPDKNSAYPWRTQQMMLLPMLLPMLLAVLLPLFLLMGWVGLTYGWWGEPVRLAHELARAEHPLFTSFMHIITSWGSPVLYAVYVALLWQAARRLGYSAAQDAVQGALKGAMQPFATAANPAVTDIYLVMRYIFYALTVTLITTQVLKFGLGMPRPGAPWPPQPLLFSMSYNSFPSGHTTEIVATALPLAVRFRSPLIWLGLALLVALVGYSRIWLGRHHPVDILAGMVLGSVAAWLICRPSKG